MRLQKLILSYLFIIIPFVALAQNETKTDAPRNIIEALSISQDGMGTVTINQPKYLESLVASHYDSGKPLLSSDGSVVVTKGYRIQIYNGNLSNSRGEAYSRANKIRSKFQSLGCYITYRAPFWRLLVGDFLYEEDAKLFMKNIVSEMPEYKREIYIVPSSIRMVGTPIVGDEY